jgi:hypothetical protein
MCRWLFELLYVIMKRVIETKITDRSLSHSTDATQPRRKREGKKVSTFAARSKKREQVGRRKKLVTH